MLINVIFLNKVILEGSKSTERLKKNIWNNFVTMYSLTEDFISFLGQNGCWAFSLMFLEDNLLTFTLENNHIYI